MEALRFQVVGEAFKKKPLDVKTPAERPSEFFGKKVFSREKMYKYLSKDAYEKMIDVMDNGVQLDRQIADAVAAGMKQWATENGVTHYTHWFQPLTEGTAEKHEYLSEIGVHSLKEIIGHTELIEVNIPDGSAIGKWQTIDFARLLHKPETDKALYWDRGAYTKVTGVKDEEMIQAAKKAINDGEEVTLDYAIKNTDRAVTTMLSGVIAKKYGEAGLPDNTINIKFTFTVGSTN